MFYFGKYLIWIFIDLLGPYFRLSEFRFLYIYLVLLGQCCILQLLLFLTFLKHCKVGLLGFLILLPLIRISILFPLTVFDPDSCVCLIGYREPPLCERLESDFFFALLEIIMRYKARDGRSVTYAKLALAMSVSKRNLRAY